MEKDLTSDDRVTLKGGQQLTGVHSEDACLGKHCSIHNPSDHHMREWAQNWRADGLLMERICPHGIGHPDPDDPRLKLYKHHGVHGCDGCCAKPHTTLEDS